MEPRTSPARRTPPVVLPAGLCAGLVSMAGLAACGRAEQGSAYAPLNAVSHSVLGPVAYAQDRPSWRYTALGSVIHLAGALFWGVVYRGVLRTRPRPTAGRLLTRAAAVTTVAAVTDFRIVPQRVTPGFEHRLSSASLVVVYTLFAAGLAAGAALALRRQGRAAPPLPRD